MEIDPKDLHISTYYGEQGPGGQHVCRVPPGIQLTHIPTGIVVVCDVERSQHRNKLKALEMLAEKLREAGHE